MYAIRYEINKYQVKYIHWGAISDITYYISIYTDADGGVSRIFFFVVDGEGFKKD